MKTEVRKAAALNARVPAFRAAVIFFLLRSAEARRRGAPQEGARLMRAFLVAPRLLEARRNFGALRLGAPFKLHIAKKNFSMMNLLSLCVLHILFLYPCISLNILKSLFQKLVFSKFGDIYDEDHFITALDGHVKVVKELPEALMQRYDYNISNIPNFHVQAWSPANYYLGEVLPVLQREGVIRVSPFANRLAMNIPPEIQFLRCLANYEALRFSSPILTLARKLVSRMIEKSSRDDGKYVSVHLRFEEDMVAFSCCVYDGGEAEKIEMDSIREKGWRQKFKLKNHLISPGLNRINGKCPLTPLEVGMLLRGMGFDNNTSIYLASGKLYQAGRYLAPLQDMFPLLHTKESLATSEELAPFMGYSSRLAALDYMVCLLSEVFVTTQGGNFPHFLMGHRRFLYDGHAKTIKPDKRKLAILMDDRINLSWKEFKEQMGVMLSESDRKGLLVPRIRRFNRKTSVYTYPLPECRCLQKSHNTNSTDNKYMLDQLLESMR